MTAFLVAGLAFGDEAKGSTCEALVREYSADLVVRYNGGCQCAHNIVLADGRHHTFAQFGSGTFVSGVRTFLSRHVLVNPVSMLVEAFTLERNGVKDALQRTIVDPRAFVITPFQRAVNRIQETARGNNRHGSTGMGIGVTREMSLEMKDSMLMIGDLPNPEKTQEKLEYIHTICKNKIMNLKFDTKGTNVQVEWDVVMNADTTIPWYLEKYKEWVNSGVRIQRADMACWSDSHIVFEGAQGMLLDEKYGFQPHTTWTDISFGNAFSILDEMSFSGQIQRVGVLRSYFTRHGAGPLPSENEMLLKSPFIEEEHNKGEEYTGSFRVGSFDLPLAAYALKCIDGIDMLAVNHLDVATSLEDVPIRISKDCTITVKEAAFLPVLEEILCTPVGIEGHGPTYEDRVFVSKEKGLVCS